MQEKELAGVPLLIFANKQDLVQALQPDEVFFKNNEDFGTIKNGTNQNQNMDHYCLFSQNPIRSWRWFDMVGWKCQKRMINSSITKMIFIQYLIISNSKKYLSFFSILLDDEILE